MKILVVFTGGTIGSRVTNDCISLDNSTKYNLLSHFDYLTPEVTFDVISPYSVLSENLSADELNLLQSTLADNICKDYDGIIVTHGTDTLQYTATAAEYAFCNCKIPIVFVSACYPLDNPQTNGYANFEAAVEFIRARCANGVFVSYHNCGEPQVSIHIPSRLLEHGECSADLYSIDNSPFAKFGGRIELCGVSPSNAAKSTGVVHYIKNPGILCIDSYPGNGYSYSLDGINSVILKPYHSATLDTANANLAELCKRASDRCVPVFVVNVKDKITYESAKLFEKLNIISLPYSTYVSVYVKIWAAISLGESVRDFVQKPVSYEFVL